MSTNREVRNVERIDRSPMNAKRWLMLLDCGHEVWTTAVRRPARRSAPCPECAVKKLSERT